MKTSSFFSDGQAECNVEFSTAKLFSEHMSIVHSLKPWLCQICSKRFKERQNFQYHSMMVSLIYSNSFYHCFKFVFTSQLFLLKSQFSNLFLLYNYFFENDRVQICFYSCFFVLHSSFTYSLFKSQILL